MLLNLAAPALMLFLQVAGTSPTPEYGLPLVGEDAERFLRTARIESIRSLDVRAVTRPRKVELTDGDRTLFAVFKTIDEYLPVKRFRNGRTELRFTDSYRHEIAAYELDKLLGLGLVPPTVARKIRKETGALSLWVVGSITEWDRLNVLKKNAPDVVAWNNQMYTVRLFIQLTYDTDYQNINNLLVTPDFKIFKIDSSRAFRLHHELRREDALKRFSIRVLDRLRSLDRTELEQRLRPWLTPAQIKALWVRRCLILELAVRRVGELGPDAVLFP